MNTPALPHGRRCAVSHRLGTASLLLLVVAFLAISPVARAQFDYRVSQGKVTITGYTGPGGDVTIPDTIIGLPVVAIDDFAFAFRDGLTGVTIPDSVALIGDGAFSYCPSLISIEVGALNPAFSSSDGVLFDKSQTLLIQCPGGKHGDYTVPDGVIRIGDDAFNDCHRLTSITIPDSVTDMPIRTFNDCIRLAAIEVGALNPAYSSSDGVLFDKSQTLLIQFPRGKAGSYPIPDGVTRIEDWAFFFCNSLTSVTIPDSLSNIDDWMFAYCSSLTAIEVGVLNPAYSSSDGVLFDKSQTLLIRCPGGEAGIYAIPDGVTHIGGWAFYDCHSLTSVTIPDSVSDIPIGAFGNCIRLAAIAVGVGNPAYYSSIDGVLFNKSQTLLIRCPGGKHGDYEVPDGVIRIEDDAFDDCHHVTSVTTPDSVTHIGDWAFAACTNLISVVIGNGVIHIGDCVFDDCLSLVSIEVGASNPVYSSSDGVLFDKSATLLLQYPYAKAGSYRIPDGVTAVFFQFCHNLTGVTIPDSVTQIGWGAFAWCTSLTNITIGKGVTELDGWTFLRCSSLTSVYFRGPPPTTDGGLFDDAEDVVVYYLPGVAGWGSTFEGRPAVLWNPALHATGVQAGGFRIEIIGTSDIPIAVEGRDDLFDSDWVTLYSGVLTGGSLEVSDPGSADRPTRFYRVRSP